VQLVEGGGVDRPGVNIQEQLDQLEMQLLKISRVSSSTTNT
jgi:hypothetical protein